MIRIDRGAPPQTLRDAHERRFRDALRSWLRDGYTREFLDAITGYDVEGVRTVLFLRQHKKCAYCEALPGLDNQPIEHFRPKRGAWRNLPGQPRRTDPTRYWWLAWEWNNLFFSCHRCNATSIKGNFFPLEPHTLPLSSLCRDIRQEQPLLLDPSEPDLLVSEHIRWQPVDRTTALPRWRWTLTARSPRGDVTRDILQLEYRADDVTDRYQETIWPRIDTHVLSPLRAGDVSAAHRAWDSLRRELIQPERALTFATWCMLEALRHDIPLLRTARLPLDPI